MVVDAMDLRQCTLAAVAFLTSLSRIRPEWPPCHCIFHCHGAEERLERRPMLDYAGCVLNNWERLDPAGTFDSSLVSR